LCVCVCVCVCVFVCVCVCVYVHPRVSLWQMSEVVQEREKKLRQSMETMGMLDCAYWTSWHLFHMLIGFVGAMVLCICGHIFQFRTFTHNDFGVMLFTFFFFTLAMSGLGYFISTLLRTSFAAIVIGLGFSLFALIMWVVCLAKSLKKSHLCKRFRGLAAFSEAVQNSRRVMQVSLLRHVCSSACRTACGLTQDRPFT
jgi:hypothetical protein